MTEYIFRQKLLLSEVVRSKSSVIVSVLNVSREV